MSCIIVWDPNNLPLPTVSSAPNAYGERISNFLLAMNAVKGGTIFGDDDVNV